jgi:nickel/cobalt exporter
MALASGFVLVTAAVLGVTHALEPDHVAGISAVTSESDSSRHATLAGGAFGAGHAVVVGVWVALWSVFDGLGVVPPWVGAVGTALVAVVLATLAGGLTLAALRRLIHRHDHTHDTGTHDHTHDTGTHEHTHDAETQEHTHDAETQEHTHDAETLEHTHDTGTQEQTHDVGTHAHYHVHVPFGIHDEHGHDHGHGGSEYLKMGVLGALFTLSPPVSMIAFLATVVPTVDAAVIWLAVGVYSLTIVLGMGVIGSGVSHVTSRLEQYGDRVHAALQLGTAGLLVVVAAHLVSTIV